MHRQLGAAECRVDKHAVAADVSGLRAMRLKVVRGVACWMNLHALDTVLWNWSSHISSCSHTCFLGSSCCM